MKKWLKYIIYSVIGIILLWIVIGYFQGKSAPQKVKTAKATTGPIEVTISANGKILAEESVDLRFTGAGRISFLPFKEGDSVKKGTLLAYLDGIVVSEQVNKSTADLRLSIEKIREFEYNNRDKPKNETYQMTKWQLEAQRDSAAALLGQSRAGYSDRTLISPINGIVSKVNASVGETPPTGEAVITVINPGTTEFEAEVDEQDIGNVREGQSVDIILDAYNNKTFKGVIRQVETIAKIGSTGNTFYPVNITIDPTDSVLLVGMNGDATILTSKKDSVVQLPSEVIYEEDDKNFVYIIENGLSRKKEITIGLQSDTSTEVVTGVAAGTEVITSDITQIKEGTKVQAENTSS